MRIAVIGHSYVTEMAQEKIVEMQKVEPDTEVHLIVPEDVSCAFGSLKASPNVELKFGTFHVCRRGGGLSNISYWLNPEDLVHALRIARPDAVLVEEDPFSLCYLAVVLALAHMSMSPVMTCFVWDNINRKRPMWRWIAKSFAQSLTFPDLRLVFCGNIRAGFLLEREKNYRGAIAILPQLGVSSVYRDLPRRTPNNGRPRIGFVGRLVEEKGVIVLLKSCKNLENLDWELVIVGNGPLERPLLELAHELGLASRVSFRQGVAHSEVAQILHGLDIFVLVSMSTPFWEEQFGLTLLQAMAAGCACIGSDSGAIPHVLGRSGRVVRQGDVGQLTLELRQLLLSPEARLLCSRSARDRAFEEFSMDFVARRYILEIKSLVALDYKRV